MAERHSSWSYLIDKLVSKIELWQACIQWQQYKSNDVFTTVEMQTNISDNKEILSDLQDGSLSIAFCDRVMCMPSIAL